MTFQRSKFATFTLLVATLTVASDAKAISSAAAYAEVRNLEISYTLSSTTGRTEGYEVTNLPSLSAAEVNASADGTNFDTILSEDLFVTIESSATAIYSVPGLLGFIDARSYSKPVGFGTFPGPLSQKSQVGSLAGDAAEIGVAIQDSLSLAYSSSYLTLLLSGPGNLSISMPYELALVYQATNSDDLWSADDAVTLIVAANNSSIFVDSDEISGEGVGPGLDGDGKFGNFLFELNTAELFLESQGLPVELTIYVGTYASSHASHRPVSDVPEPTSLALLGMAVVWGRRRFRRE